MFPSRRQFVTGGTAAALMAALPWTGARAAAFAPDDADWRSFKSRFVLADGRVVDTGNNGISHSEGQSYGMLFAVAFNDQPTFDLISGWTVANLARRGDALHVWRYLPDQSDHTPDQNNATDGDLLIAMALNRAAILWGRPDHAKAARAIAHDIRELLIANAGSRLVLLPGLTGFARKTATVVNLSYYNFVALRELAALDPSPLWQLLMLDGLALMQAARFGQWQLPPDWLAVPLNSGQVRIASGWPPLCSYDAIRVPLNLAWARTLPPDIGQSFTTFWTTSAAYQPAWANLMTNAVSSYAATGGLVAVKAVTMAAAGQSYAPTFPSVQASADYYSAALTLLSRLAWMEGHGEG
ncbi:MAG: endoglucanase [Proteobacteria bacterium]|nr:endoglucanase [Pseudomonadota bacterium]